MNKYQFALFYITHKQYRDVGGSSTQYIFKDNSESISVIKELVDKATPIKVLFREFHGNGFMCDRYNSGKCPVCKVDNDNYYDDKYCRHCGQALDWSKDE